MSSVELSHVNIQGVNCAVFAADSINHSSSGRSGLLRELTIEARRSGLAVEKSALAYTEFGSVSFYGTPDLVRYLASAGMPRITHRISF